MTALFTPGSAENIENVCSKKSLDDCILSNRAPKNTNYIDTPTEYSEFFSQKMYEDKTGSAAGGASKNYRTHEFDVCNIAEYKWDANGVGSFTRTKGAEKWW